MAKKTIADRPTRNEIKAFLELKDAKAEAEREARRVEREIKPLREKIDAYVRQETVDRGKRRQVTVLGYVLAIVKCRGRVPWKDVAVAECHPETIRDYEENVPDREVLEVTKA